MSHNLINDQGFSALYKAKHGYMLINRYDTYIGRSISAYGEWSEDEVELFNSICEEGDYVIEVGSNIGTHTIPLAKKVGQSGRLYAFEPQRIVYQNLCANISLNSLTNVECSQQAVSNTEGIAFIANVNYSENTNFGAVTVDNEVRGDNGTTVDQVILDHSLDGLPHLKLLKVDVENMELPVVLGAKNLIHTHRPFLYLENNPCTPNETKLLEVIESLNYTVYQHSPLLYSPNNFFNNPDNVFSDTRSFNIFCVPNEKPLSMNYIEQFGLKRVIEATPVPVD